MMYQNLQFNGIPIYGGVGLAPFEVGQIAPRSAQLVQTMNNFINASTQNMINPNQVTQSILNNSATMMKQYLGAFLNTVIVPNSAADQKINAWINAANENIRGVGIFSNGLRTADVNGDGAVNALDFTLFAMNVAAGRI